MSMEARSGPNTVVRGRIGLAAGLCAAAFSVIVIRLVEVMVFGAGLAATADVAAARQPMRADFVDRNGVLIARDLPVSDLYVTPAAFWDTDEAARVLAKTTGADAARLKEAFAAKRGYVLVRRGLTPDIRDAERMQGFDVDWTKPAESVARAGHRWKLVGNAVSAMASEWLGRRLATPGTYVHQLDPPLATDRTLPIAGWSMGKGAMEAVAVTRWAARVERPPLMKWLKFAPRPLSFKATRGFLERSQRSSLRFEAGFLDDLRKHEAAMREPDDLGRRAAAS